MPTEDECHMSDALKKYRECERQLLACRMEHPAGSEFEDHILEEMDPLWWGMAQAERDLLDSEPAMCWPEHATKPWDGAEVGVNLFWLPGLQRYVYLPVYRGPKFAVHFLVNAGRRYVKRALLPEPTAVHLVSVALGYISPRQIQIGHAVVIGGCFVEEFHLVFEQPPDSTPEELQERIRKDPHMFDSARLPQVEPVKTPEGGSHE